MMAKNKLTLQFSGFAEMAEKLEELEGDLKKTTERALQESFDYVTPKLKADIQRHRRTGQTEQSLRLHEKVEWEGSVASIGVGFDIENGGLPSVFLMHGTPRMKPDKKLYDDIYGSATVKQVREIQSKVFADEIKKKMEG